MHRFAGITNLLKPVTGRRRSVLALIQCLLLISLLLPATAKANTELERKVKAAFVYNFAKFVEWPFSVDNPNNQFVICLAGQTLVGELINNSLEDKPIKGRSIHVRNIGGSTENLDGCHMLYVNGSRSTNIDRVLQAARNKPILTIGESPDFTRQGGIIQFLVVDDKVRFAINQAAANVAGLSISAKLLEVSYKVIPDRSDLDRHNSYWRYAFVS